MFPITQGIFYQCAFTNLSGAKQKKASFGKGKIEKGDYIEVEIDQNQIILKPRKLIDPIQGWYWTKEWQKMEVDVDKEIEKNLLSPEFRTAEEGLKWLKE